MGIGTINSQDLWCDLEIEKAAPETGGGLGLDILITYSVWQRTQLGRSIVFDPVLPIPLFGTRNRFRFVWH